MRQFLIVVLLLVGILVPAYWYYTHHVVSGGATQAVVVERVQGDVSRDGRDGQGYPVMTGDALPTGSVVRTSKASSVSLRIPDGGKVELAEETELAVHQVFDDAVSFELRSGQVEATVKHFNKRRIDMVFAGNSKTLRIVDGDAVVTADGTGAFDVGVKRGQDVAIVSPDGGEKQVQAGHHAAVRRDGIIAESGEIPRSVLLKVAWPEETVQTARTVEVRGAVSPGSRVEVEGKPVQTDVDGSFRTQVPLEEGTNTITVTAKGLGGKVVKKSPEIKVDTRPPRVEAATDDIWK